jgi:hypothetical protein
MAGLVDLRGTVRSEVVGPDSRPGAPFDDHRYELFTKRKHGSICLPTFLTGIQRHRMNSDI